MRSDEVPYAIAAFLVMVAGLILALRTIWRRMAPPAEAPRSERPSAMVPVVGADGIEPVLCVCGAPATRPVSRTRARVTWWDGIRLRLGWPASYEQFIPSEAPPQLCDVHGRTWDAKLRARRATVIASKRAECDEGIAVEMAAMESETLMAELVASLTDGQRRAAKRAPPSALRVVGKTGTDEGSNGT